MVGENIVAILHWVNDVKLCLTDWKLGGISKWSDPLIVCAHECTIRGKWGFQIFGVLTQIWAAGPNSRVLCNRILNVDNKKYSLLMIALIVVELFQENNQF